MTILVVDAATVLLGVSEIAMTCSTAASTYNKPNANMHKTPTLRPVDMCSDQI